MALAVSIADADAFAETMRTPKYARNERDYKVAVHTVVRRLLAPPVIDREDWAELLRGFLEGKTDFTSIGLTDEERVRVVEVSNASGDLRNQLANLAGGRFGVAQYIWMISAIEKDLGTELQSVFKALVDTALPLPDRVDRFRDELYDVQKELKERGGFKPEWRLLQVSLSFVAAVLGAFDPSQFCFYHATRLRRSLEALGGEWPHGTAGERYAAICRMVMEVFDQLKQHGAPVADLIDAQSFLWMRGEEIEREQQPIAMPGIAASEVAAPTENEVVAELVRRIYWDEDRARRLVKLASRASQLIFYGPPGTGKTFVALQLAKLLAGEAEEGHVRLAQFHPSYAYEDFVEGIRPKLATAGLSYEVRKGVLRRLVDDARKSPGQRFFLIIDEINRANLPRVFGELLFGLEYRGPGNPIELPYSEEESFYIPEGLSLIGTMNTADRSIALMDAALRRRFRHVEFEPDLEVLRRYWEGRGNAALADSAPARLKALNDELVAILDRDRLIGHSYLMKPELPDIGFEAVWVEELEPVLREHLFARIEDVDQLKKVFLS